MGGNTHQRKATRYNSQSVLSGLLFCAERVHSYRRIAKPSGKIVWRCAGWVEHGKSFAGIPLPYPGIGATWFSLMAVYGLSRNVWNISRCSRIKSILAAGYLV